MSVSQNPIKGQYVFLNLDWGDLTSPACNDTDSVVQTILDLLQPKTYILDCLVITPPKENNTQDVLQALIDKVCNLPSSSSSTVEVVWDIEFCNTDNFDCESNVCIVPNPCGDLTNEEIIQALTSRLVGLSTLAKDLCDKIQANEDAITLIQTNGC